MKVLTTTVARIIFAIPFLMFGFNHLANGEMMSSMIPAWMPAPLILNYIAGLGLVLAGIAIIIKKKADLACLLLALELLIIILTMHLPNWFNGADDNIKMMGMINALKDLGLMAGALTYAGIFSNK